MKITIFKEVEIEHEIDINIDDIVDEFCRRVEPVGENQWWRHILPVLDSVTRILAKIDDETIGAMPNKARQIVRERLEAELKRY